MTSMLSDSTSFLQAVLATVGVPCYEGVAAPGTAYPLLTHQVIAGGAEYSLRLPDGSWQRIDKYNCQIACYALSVRDCLALVDTVEAAIVANAVNVLVNTTMVMASDRTSTIGVRWLGKTEHYQAILGVRLTVTNNASVGAPVQPPSKIIKTGTQALNIGDTQAVVVYPWGFTPVSVFATVVGPLGAPLILCKVAANTYSPTGFIAEFSSPIPSAGYALDFLGVNS